MAELLTLRIPSTILDNGKKLAKQKGYINVQEFVRDVLRQHIAREMALSLQGSTKYAKTLSKKERDKLARAL